MAFTVRGVESLVRLLDRHPEWLEALRQRLLTRELLRAPETFRAIEGTLRTLAETVAALAEAQRRTQGEVAAARAEADRRFAELAEAQRRTEEQVQALAEAQRRVEARLRGIEGPLWGSEVEAEYRMEGEPRSGLAFLGEAG